MAKKFGPEHNIIVSSARLPGVISHKANRPALPRPEVIFFDLGDTLMRAHPSWAGVYRQVLVEHGIDVSEDDLAAALVKATRDGDWMSEEPFEATAEASFERIKDFDRRALGELGVTDLSDDLFTRIEEAFVDRSSWFIFPDVVPAVEAISAAGIRMGLISNWVWGAPELLHDVDLARHFDGMAISARVGYMKPNGRIFEHALKQLDATPAASIHVGDSYAADVVGARRVGMTPVLIARNVGDPARIRQENEDPDLHVVADLFELLDLLGIDRPTKTPEPTQTPEPQTTTA
jgi:putative hydrolase of the HAD superfamily